MRSARNLCYACLSVFDLQLALHLFCYIVYTLEKSRYLARDSAEH
jgi:hypothetical protein